MAQKTILQLVQQVAPELGLSTPVTVVSSTDPNVQKINALVHAVQDDLVTEFDWQALVTPYTVTTVAGTQGYAFPADYERWISGTFYDSSTRWPIPGPVSPGVWNSLVANVQIPGPFERFRIFQNKLQFLPVPASAYTVNCEYISNNVVLDGSTGNPKQDYTQDSDKSVFDYRLVVYGVKYKWLASNGMDTTSALVDYTRALSNAKAQDTPKQTLSLNGKGRGYRLLGRGNIPDGNFGV